MADNELIGNDTGLLPFSLEAEQSVLGAILIEPESISDVAVRLKPEHFYLPQHKAIYSIMMDLELEQSGSIDTVVVLERLKKEKEENEKKVEQLDHRIQRLENRIKYYQDGERKRRTHRLCTIAGTLESIAPEIKELDITEVMELLEHIFHKEEIQKLVHRMKINHDSRVKRAKEG